jgi:hypothetical protein
MSDIPRRKLEELFFVYERHPELRDVFVEGAFDSAIVKWFLQACCIRSVGVYEISTVELPDGDIIISGRKANNRERVVFLGKLLAGRFSTQATCVVDADFSYLTKQFEQCPVLFYTDYASMEMYFFQEDVIGKFVTICCRRGDWPVNRIMRSLSIVLQEFFLYRLANEELRWEMDWLDRVACLEIRGWDLEFDGEEFILRFLNKNAKADKRKEFIGKVDSLRPLLQADPRYQMHGHDFVAVLAWYIRNKGVPGEHTTPENVQTALALSMNYAALKGESLFGRLLERLT